MNIAKRLLYLLHRGILPLALVGCMGAAAVWAQQQPSEPVDVTPIDGQAYYLINQMSGMQADLNAGSTTAGDSILQQTRSFTSLSQRWALTRLAGNAWAISNLASGLCLDSVVSGASTNAVQNPCAPASTTTQQWTLMATSNGYVILRNQGSGLLLDVSSESTSAGAELDESAAATSPTRSQQWLLRPVYFRGVDNALLEKQESERLAANVPWWRDAGQSGDVLQILKNHGVNIVRVRPTSEPPYSSYTALSCTGNGCYTETDAADLNLAKRAKQLGMAVELTLFFDGASSKAIPDAWSGDTLSQAQTDIYNYVKSEVEAFRQTGAMPDMVTIGNEVDTGFLGSLGSPTGSNFANFAALETQAMQAIVDASSDPSVGPPLPPPIRCIHVTPAWDLTNFFTYVNDNNIPYDAMCQSYYPFDHGPLTTAQAASSNPNNKPVETTALTNAANTIGKPIFLIETAEHYENGFQANDPWYPPTMAGQRQFLIDLDGVMQGLPNHLGMGISYWDPAGVNIPAAGGGYTNGDGSTDAIYTWNGLTIFDNADTTGSSQSSAANYSAILPAADALGGRLDSTITYKLVNVASGQVLETTGSATASGFTLSTAMDSGALGLNAQWKIASDGDGYFQIANGSSAGTAADVLDTLGSGSTGAAITANTANPGAPSQEWDVITAGGGYYAIVNKGSVLVLAATSNSIVQQQPSAATSDWVTATPTQEWKIVPARMTAAGFSLSASQSNLSLAAGGSSTVSLTITPSGGYTGSITMSCASTLANVTCSFNPITYTADGSNTALNGSVSIAAPKATAENAPYLPGRSNPLLPAAVILFPGGMLWGIRRRRRSSGLFVIVLLLACGLCMTACGGGSAGSGGGGGGGGGGTTQPQTGSVTILAKAATGGASQSVLVSVTIQ